MNGAKWCRVYGKLNYDINFSERCSINLIAGSSMQKDMYWQFYCFIAMTLRVQGIKGIRLFFSPFAWTFIHLENYHIERSAKPITCNYYRHHHYLHIQKLCKPFKRKHYAVCSICIIFASNHSFTTNCIDFL